MRLGDGAYINNVARIEPEEELIRESEEVEREIAEKPNMPEIVEGDDAEGDDEE